MCFPIMISTQADEGKSPAHTPQDAARNTKGPERIGAFEIVRLVTAPRDKISMIPSYTTVKLLSKGAYPRISLPQNRRSTEPKRGPDGIRTRICHHREVLCFRYTTGPARL